MSSADLNWTTTLKASCRRLFWTYVITMHSVTSFVDVRICSPCAGDRPEVIVVARRDGEAAERGVK
eukprot:9213841-Lingulodinium_polyedra.AAC.1